MAEETENLVLEHLRAMRATQDDVRSEMRDGFARVSRRIDRLGTAMRGLSYIVGTAAGAVLADMEDLKTRVGALEERGQR